MAVRSPNVINALPEGAMMTIAFYQSEFDAAPK
jgi:hypothetical protein